MSNLILTDVDDTLLIWLKGFEFFLEKEHDIKVSETPPDGWALGEWMGIPEDKVRPYIEEFNHDSWEFGCLPVLEHAKSQLSMLNQAYGYRFVAISSCSNHPLTVALRKANLFHIFGDVFEEVHCLPLAQHKSDYLKNYEPTWWVEDRYVNAVEGLECGHKPIMLRNSQNIKDEAGSDRAIRWVNDWRGVRDLISVE